MTMPSAGWYPDPDDGTRSRWWNGAAWTDSRSDFQAPIAPVAPMPPVVPSSYSMNSTSLRAPAGTPWNTVWIWLVVVLPYVSSLGIFFIDWSSVFDISRATSKTAMLGLILSPGYLFAVFGGIIAYGLSAWFAYLDYRELGRRGIPRPFHWAFAFISYAVYPIGRSVVVRKRTGRGISPMWVSIALMVLIFVASIGFSVYLISTVVAQIPQYSPSITP